MFSRRSFALFGGHEDEIHCLVFSRDLEILLTGSIQGWIRLWNTVEDHLTMKIGENQGCIRALAISNNDQYFASTANDARVRVYHTRTSQLLHTLTEHTRVADCLQFSSDSRWIASGGWDHRTLLWDVQTGELFYSFRHHTNAVQSIAFHPNRNLMVTGSHDHTLLLYHFDEPIRLRGHFNNICAVAFSIGSYLASAGWEKIIHLWHIDTCRLRTRLLGHTGWIRALTFSSHDHGLLASADDEAVHVWNVLAGFCLHRLRIDHDLCCFIRFSPNDQGLLAGGAVYELPKTRWNGRTRRVRESVSHDRTIKLPMLQPRRKKNK